MMERRFTTEERGWLNEFLIQGQRQTAALETVTIALGQIGELLSILVRQQEILLMRTAVRDAPPLGANDPDDLPVPSPWPPEDPK